MRAVLIKHDLLNEDIMIIMDSKDNGTTIGINTGFTTEWVDNLGEDEIEEVALGWLEYQSYMDVRHGDLYTGFRWWKQGEEFTPEERRKELPNMIFDIY